MRAALGKFRWSEEAQFDGCSLVITMAVSLGSLFILIRSPRDFRLALFPRTVRLLVGLTAIVFLIWQFAVWYNPSSGMSGFPPSIGINGVPPVIVWGDILALFICVRAAYLWWLRRRTDQYSMWQFGNACRSLFTPPAVTWVWQKLQPLELGQPDEMRQSSVRDLRALKPQFR